MRYMQPDVITFNEIPLNYTWQMTNFVAAFLPGYNLATNSGTDGYICSVIASRFPIARSQSWLARASLAPFGYTNANPYFTRDLFEAEIAVPGFEQPLHVFTAHLKAGTSTNDLARRAAEASAISNYFVRGFLTTNGQRPYVLTGDLNEDILRPPNSSQHPVQRLTASAVGLRLLTPHNSVTSDDRTISIRTGLSARFDYLLPGGLLFSNLDSSEVFRTDLLDPLPAALLTTDSQTASDHLPVLVTFRNPFDTPFRVTDLLISNQVLRLSWQSSTGRHYQVEGSGDLLNWTAQSVTLTATGSSLSWTTNASERAQSYRVLRAP